MLYSLRWQILDKFIKLEINNGILSKVYLSDVAQGNSDTENIKDKEIIEKIKNYISGVEFSLDEIEVNINDLTRFQQQVMKVMRDIPPAITISYSDLAMKAGYPKAVRAVGNVCAKNPILLVFPCHRVIGKKSIGKFGYGIDVKRKIIQHEKEHFRKK